MFLLWILVFLLLGFVGFGLTKKFEKSTGWYDFGGILIFINAVILLFMISFSVSEYQDIKEEIYKIEALQDVIHSENLLDLKDTTIMNNLRPDILLEKKINYNEKIIEWQAENKWWKSAIYIPAKVDELELIK